MNTTIENQSAKIPWVYLAGEQKIKWALDEDLRWVREALKDHACFTSLARARIVHAAWWPALLAIGAEALRGKAVFCFADNPPAFYLTQPLFAEAAAMVDLWVARSREALGQFHSLGMRAIQVPYCIDPQVFRPLAETASIRREHRLPPEAFVIGNFHRDSEGNDLNKPKAQKGPDIFLAIARELHRRVPRTVVLLAGPRRHWLRRELEKAGVPCRFAGAVTAKDDYEINILDRERLNRLYQCLDVCVISSRWEGGPYSVIEALFAGRPVLSTPVGMARDALPGQWLYRSVDEAVSLLEKQARSRVLDGTIDGQREKTVRYYSKKNLEQHLLAAYEPVPRGAMNFSTAARCGGMALLHRVVSRLAKAPAGKASVSSGARAAGILPAETPVAPAIDRNALDRSAADIAWFRQ